MTSSLQRFELRRRVDSLVYLFERMAIADPWPAFRRSDGPYLILRHPRFGWIAGEQGKDEIYGRPWNMVPGEQTDVPPEGIWVSRKGDKSYVYALVHLT